MVFNNEKTSLINGNSPPFFLFGVLEMNVKKYVINFIYFFMYLQFLLRGYQIQKKKEKKKRYMKIVRTLKEHTFCV